LPTLTLNVSLGRAVLNFFLPDSFILYKNALNEPNFIEIRDDPISINVNVNAQYLASQGCPRPDFFRPNSFKLGSFEAFLRKNASNEPNFIEIGGKEALLENYRNIITA